MLELIQKYKWSQAQRDFYLEHLIWLYGPFLQLKKVVTNAQHKFVFCHLHLQDLVQMEMGSFIEFDLHHLPKQLGFEVVIELECLPVQKTILPVLPSIPQDTSFVSDRHVLQFFLQQDSHLELDVGCLHLFFHQLRKSYPIERGFWDISRDCYVFLFQEYVLVFVFLLFDY